MAVSLGLLHSVVCSLHLTLQLLFILFESCCDSVSLFLLCCEFSLWAFARVGKELLVASLLINRMILQFFTRFDLCALEVIIVVVLSFSSTEGACDASFAYCPASLRCLSLLERCSCLEISLVICFHLCVGFLALFSSIFESFLCAESYASISLQLCLSIGELLLFCCKVSFSSFDLLVEVFLAVFNQFLVVSLSFGHVVFELFLPFLFSLVKLLLVGFFSPFDLGLDLG